MVDICLCDAAVTPIQRVEHRDRRNVGLRHERLQQTHRHLAQQTGMTIRLPRVRLLQGALLPRLQPIRVPNALAMAESMLVVKQESVVDIENLVVHVRRQRGAQHPRERQTRLGRDHVGMRHAGDSRLARPGSETIRPPIRPSATNRLDLVGVLALHGLEKLARHCRAQLRPLILLVPLQQHLATLGRWRRVVRKITRMLRRKDVVRIILRLHLV